MKFNRNAYIFIQENVFENVICNMATNLSRHQCVIFFRKESILDGRPPLWRGLRFVWLVGAVLLACSRKYRETCQRFVHLSTHYDDIIMSAMASQITSITIVYSTASSGADQRKHQGSASLAFVGGIHRWLHKGPVTRKMFPFDDVIMRVYDLWKYIFKMNHRTCDAQSCSSKCISKWLL